MNYNINDLLTILKQGSENTELLKEQNFCEAICYYSKNEKIFFQNFKNFENTDSRLEVYSILLTLLPITQNIIKYIRKQNFFESDDFEGKFKNREEDYIEKYFSQSEKFYRELKNNSFNLKELEDEILELEKKLNKIRKENEDLQNKSSEINELKKKNIELRKKIVDEKISSEENFKLNKLHEKVEIFNKKLNLLKESYE